MDHYPKLFIKTSLIYLIIGVLVGIGMSANLMVGVRFSFVHIHANLLGFMVMMIAGVSYHVLPRFASRELPWPKGIKFHFYFQNVGLLGMISTYLMGYRETSLFLLFAVIAAISLMIMVYNLFFIFFPPLNKNKGANGKHPRPNCQEDCCPEAK